MIGAVVTDIAIVLVVAAVITTASGIEIFWAVVAGYIFTFTDTPAAVE